MKITSFDFRYLLQEQERLTATKDGPFLDPVLTPPVLNSPFLPSWN